MDRRNPFHRQAELMVRVLSYVARRDEFALKGGTAINLFLRDLLRLSVDIDRAVVSEVQESLGYTENRILSFNDLYAGKMCAARTRAAHPPPVAG